MPCLSKCLPPVSLHFVSHLSRDQPLLITFFSAHHSPSTVKRNASEFVMGTVRLSSALPISMKNHTLPVIFNKRGTAYAGRLSTPMTAYHIPKTFLFSHEVFGSLRDGR